VDLALPASNDCDSAVGGGAGSADDSGFEPISAVDLTMSASEARDATLGCAGSVEDNGSCGISAVDFALTASKDRDSTVGKGVDSADDNGVARICAVDRKLSVDKAGDASFGGVGSAEDNGSCGISKLDFALSASRERDAAFGGSSAEGMGSDDLCAVSAHSTSRPWRLSLALSASKVRDATVGGVGSAKDNGSCGISAVDFAMCASKGRDAAVGVGVGSVEGMVSPNSDDFCAVSAHSTSRPRKLSKLFNLAISERRPSFIPLSRWLSARMSFSALPGRTAASFLWLA